MAKRSYPNGNLVDFHGNGSKVKVQFLFISEVLMLHLMS